MMAGASGATPLGEVAEPGLIGLAVLWFEVLSSLAVVAVGIAFAIVGWDQFVGSGRAWVVALLVVGGGAAAAVVPLAGAGKHAAAALAALIAVVAPAGFAYPVSVLMVAVAVIEAARAWHPAGRGRAATRGDCGGCSG